MSLITCVMVNETGLSTPSSSPSPSPPSTSTSTSTSTPTSHPHPHPHHHYHHQYQYSLLIFSLVCCLIPSSCYAQRTVVYFKRPTGWGIQQYMSTVPSISWSAITPPYPGIPTGTKVGMTVQGGNWFSFSFPNTTISILLEFSQSNLIDSIIDRMARNLSSSSTWYYDGSKTNIEPTNSDPRTPAPPISYRGCYVAPSGGYVSASPPQSGLALATDINIRTDGINKYTLHACARQAQYLMAGYFGFRSDGLCYIGYQYGIQDTNNYGNQCKPCNIDSTAMCGTTVGNVQYTSVYRTNICSPGFSMSTNAAFVSSPRLASTWSATTLQLDGKPFTMSFWMRRETNTQTDAFIQKGSFRIFWNYNQLNVIYDGVGGTIDFRTPSSSASPYSTWYWWSLTIDPLGDAILYKNGEFVINTSGSRQGLQNTDSQTFTIGGTGSNSYIGFIDDFRVYDRVLTQTELSIQYTTQSWSSFDPNLIMELLFEEEIGNIIYDTSRRNGVGNFGGNPSNVRAANCLDINECLDPLSCGSGVACTNTIGSYQCSDTGQCALGYDKDKGVCIDVDECKDGSHQCTSGSTCINVQGGYICSPVITSTSLTPSVMGVDGIKTIVNGTIHIQLLNYTSLTPTISTLEIGITTATRTSIVSSITSFRIVYAHPSNLSHPIVMCNNNLPFAALFTSTNINSYSYKCQLSPRAGTRLMIGLMTCIMARHDGFNTTVRNTRNVPIVTTITSSTQICITTYDPTSTFSYAPVIITPSTLQLVGTGASIPTPNLFLNNTSPQLISFRGYNFLPAIITSITYGPYTCTYTSDASTLTQITCQTRGDETGVGLTFRIGLLGDEYIQGTDTMSYPTIPTIKKIYGCPTNSTIIPGATQDCPTAGGITLTVVGTAFVNPLTVLIGGKSVLVTHIDVPTSTLTFKLNEGVGQDISVIVSVNAQFSASYPWLSYGAPIITNIIGCDTPMNATSTLRAVGCNRDGFDVITIQGHNFGAEGATVFIANTRCNDVQHNDENPHQELTCRLPPGRGVDRVVLILQKNGQLSQTTAAMSYQQCPPGSINNPDERQSSCILCMAGSYTNLVGDITCYQCPQGTSSAMNGTTSCGACEAGTYSPVAGAINCTACPPGQSQTSKGQSKCIDCSVGWYSSSPGATSCEKCGIGTFSDRPGASTCTTCPSGSWSSEPGATICEPCKAGWFFYSRGKGNTTIGANTTGCIPCPAGSVSKAAGASTCEVCSKGTFASADATECFPCNDGYVAPLPGQTLCQQCPSGSIANDGRTTCVCGVGLYQQISVAHASEADVDTHVDHNAKITCQPCPDGIDCTSIGQTFDSLSVKPGWWRANNQSLTMYECLYSTHCQGGVQATCGIHRTGPLCALCLPGYRAATLTSDCSTCPAAQQSIAVTVIVTLLILTALFLLYWIIIRADKSKMKAQSQRKRFQSLWDEELWSHPQRLPEINVSSRYRHNPTHAIKIVIGFLQIITTISVQFSIPWPSVYRSMAAAFSFINIDFIPWQQLGCAVTISYYTKLLTVTLIPFGIMFILACILLFPSYWADYHDFGDDLSARQQRKFNRYRWVKLSMFTIFLMYPSISSNVLALFACKTVEGTSYVTADFTLICYDSEWNRYLGYAIAMTILYPIGAPVAAAISLYRYRHRLMENEIMVALGFLYSGYTSSEYWWEVLDLSHKLFLTSLIQFFPIHLQLGAAMICVVLYTCILLIRRPYAKNEDDRLHLLSQAILYLLLLGGRILQVNSPNGLDHASDIALSTLFVILLILVLIAFIIRIIHILRILLRKRQRALMKHKRDVTLDENLVYHHKLIDDDNAMKSTSDEPITSSPLAGIQHNRIPTLTTDPSQMGSDVGYDPRLTSVNETHDEISHEGVSHIQSHSHEQIEMSHLPSHQPEISQQSSNRVAYGMFASPTQSSLGSQAQFHVTPVNPSLMGMGSTSSMHSATLSAAIAKRRDHVTEASAAQQHQYMPGYTDNNAATASTEGESPFDASLPVGTVSPSLDWNTSPLSHQRISGSPQ